MSETLTQPDEITGHDWTQHNLPIPSKDGHKADLIRLQIAGGIDLDLYDETALAFIDSLRLGQELELTVTARVTASGWRHGLKGEDQEDHVVYQVGLKAHSIDLPEAAA